MSLRQVIRSGGAFAAALGLCILGGTPALAIGFGPIETVDTGAVATSDTRDESASHAFGAWHAVYVNGGRAMVAAHTDTGWQTPVPLSPLGATAGSPVIATDDERVHVVWHDDRTGHDEVYTRRYDGTSWTSDECLTCDGTPSRNPGLDAFGFDFGSGRRYAHVAYEEGAPGSTQIHGRTWDNAPWGGVEVWSASPGAATQPSVARAPFGGEWMVAWTDTRETPPNIYLRAGEDPEFPIVATSGLERMNPSAHGEYCCGDVFSPYSVVTFDELEPSVPVLFGSLAIVDWEAETWIRFPLDGFEGRTSGFDYRTDPCGSFGTSAGLYQTVHVSESGAVQVQEDWGDSQLVAENAVGSPAIGVVGPQDSGLPDTEVLVLWVEAGALMSAIGTRDGGYVNGWADPSPSFLIAPDGSLSTSARVVDLYSGEPASEEDFIEIYLQSSLEASLNLVTEFPIETDTAPDGVVEIMVEGGGCSQAGDAFFNCGNILTSTSWPGIKSPDVDGDCFVDDTDRAYVGSVMGTADFCGDLDGSGIVDASDIAIVDLLLDTFCSTVGVSEPPVAEVLVRSAPNPASHLTILRIDVPGAQRASVAIFDATGRVVRDYGERRLDAGVNLIGWDTRDARGRLVGAGGYFALVMFGDRTITERIVVVR